MKHLESGGVRIVISLRVRSPNEGDNGGFGGKALAVVGKQSSEYVTVAAARVMGTEFSVRARSAESTPSSGLH